MRCAACVRGRTSTDGQQPTWKYYSNGQLLSEEYLINGKFHNPNGPAYRYWHSNGQLKYEQYLIKGGFHNPNGPAYRRWYSNGQLAYESYYIDGKELTKEKFENRNQSCNGKVIKIEGKKYKLVEEKD